jgi:hypothetical protein
VSKPLWGDLSHAGELRAGSRSRIISDSLLKYPYFTNYGDSQLVQSPDNSSPRSTNGAGVEPIEPKKLRR